MTQRRGAKEKYLVSVLSISFVLGMGVALGIYLAWKSGEIPPGFNTVLSAIALVLCPPFVLSFAIGPTPDSDLALVLVVGTIVLANAFLYAGVAAGGYFLISVLRKSKGR